MEINTGSPVAHLTPYLQAVARAYAAEQNILVTPDCLVRRVFGGANNAIYKIETETESLACKLCVEDGRQRAAREFGALEVIWNAGINIAPRPIFIDESKSTLPYPAVIYQWVEGAKLQEPLTERQLENFLDSYHRLHSILPSKFPAFQLKAWFHWFDFDAYLQEIKELAARYTPWLAEQKPDGGSLVTRLESCVQICAAFIQKSKVSPKQEHIPLRLMRVDPNTANAILGKDDHIRWIDWEYSGWGDPALDIAELRWHAALQPLGEAALQWLRANYKPSFSDSNFGERLRVWDHILATRWPFLILRVLWSNHNGPDRERLSQTEVSSQQYYQRLKKYLELAEALFSGDRWRF